MELSEFLLARIAENEEAVAVAEKYAVLRADADSRPAVRVNAKDGRTLWSTDQLRGECEAKRRIVERAAEVSEDHINYDHAAEIFADDVLRLLAVPFAGHPDYNEEWKP